MTVRTVFMGSPEFALPSLSRLAEICEVVGVVTQPDKPAGRGRRLTPPPVKLLAESLGIPVIQPRRLRDPAAMDQLRAWQPELIVVAAFGQILRQEVLELPTHGCINVHASLLPHWRGAAPIQAALLAGDLQTGISIMLMDAGIDTGPVLAQQATPILPHDTAGSLSHRLAQEGAELLGKTLPAYLAGTLLPRDQSEISTEEPTYAPMLKKEDGRLDFSQSAEALERQVRAFNPWPGAYFEWQGQPFKVHRARAAFSNQPRTGPAPAPGQTLAHDGLPAVAASPGLLLLEEVQPAGKKPLPGDVFLRGARGWD